MEGVVLCLLLDYLFSPFPFAPVFTDWNFISTAKTRSKSFPRLVYSGRGFLCLAFAAVVRPAKRSGFE